MALSKKQMIIIGSGVAVIIGLYSLKKKILAAVDQAHVANAVAMQAAGAPEAAVPAAPVKGFAGWGALGAYVASPAYQGVGDATPAPGASVTQTLNTVSSVVGTSVSTLTGVVTLAMGYLALKEKRQALAAPKAA